MDGSGWFLGWPANLIKGYYDRVTGDDLEIARQAALHWGDWEGCKISLRPEVDMAGASFEEIGGDYLEMAKFEIAYTHNKAWMPSDSHILDNMHKISHIPGVIICGRYDTITPVESSFKIAQSWPSAELKIIEATGHAFFEAGIINAHVEATDRFASQKHLGLHVTH